MKRVLQWGGIASGLVLVAFGIVAIVMGVSARSTVQDNLKAEQITGTPDMTPALIAKEAKDAHLNVSLPTCNVAGQAIDTGTKAHCFAQYMRIHTLESTKGFTYSQMGIYTAKPDAPQSALEPGGGTSDTKYAVIDPKTGQPQSNGPRQIWVTETALTTALNTSYMAQQLALFGIVVGIALLLSGIGFVIVALGGPLALHLRREKPESESPGVPVTA
jgi:hypothetical protein